MGLVSAGRRGSRGEDRPLLLDRLDEMVLWTEQKLKVGLITSLYIFSWGKTTLACPKFLNSCYVTNQTNGYLPPRSARCCHCTSSIWDVCGNILCLQQLASSSVLLKVLWYSFSICFFSGIIFPRFSNEVLAVILSLILTQIIPPDLTNKTRIESDSLPFLCYIMS